MEFRETYLVMYTAAAPNFVGDTDNNKDNGEDEDEDDAI